MEKIYPSRFEYEYRYIFETRLAKNEAAKILLDNIQNRDGLLEEDPDKPFNGIFQDGIYHLGLNFYTSRFDEFIKLTAEIQETEKGCRLIFKSNIRHMPLLQIIACLIIVVAVKKEIFPLALIMCVTLIFAGIFALNYHSITKEFAEEAEFIFGDYEVQP